MCAKYLNIKRRHHKTKDGILGTYIEWLLKSGLSLKDLNRIGLGEAIMLVKGEI